MSDLTDRTVLITGATDGLGRGVAHALSARGATVLVHGRDPGRIAATVSELIDAGGDPVQIRAYRADLGDLSQVRRLAEEVSVAEPRLDVLVNNAGIGGRVPGGETRSLSADGHELRFAVNYLSGYLLTRMLLPLLRASAPARIVNVSSAGQAPIDFDDVMLERDYSGWQAYCQSKLAQILFTVDLAEELAGTGVTANALHPSTFMPTKMVLNEPQSTLEQGIDATVRLIADPDIAGVTGHYFNVRADARAHAQAYDPRARARLRELSDRLVGLAGRG
jgi:NAD(P)-dependent dehydrogenase (short-subunit alcohol dehydrogenase family)